MAALPLPWCRVQRTLRCGVAWETTKPPLRPEIRYTTLQYLRTRSHHSARFDSGGLAWGERVPSQPASQPARRRQAKQPRSCLPGNQDTQTPCPVRTLHLYCACLGEGAPPGGCLCTCHTERERKTSTEGKGTRRTRRKETRRFRLLAREHRRHSAHRAHKGTQGTQAQAQAQAHAPAGDLRSGLTD